ncbi:hypothetical protein LCGC14_0846830 [marine sediment metagenome]|uniref:Uncharacterized protein n=1 Tax=marine sediment metagenome TaxID=412755 RepID=A0A0F9PWS0_9ZZZZ
MKTFEEFTQERPAVDDEQDLLIQAIAIVSSHPDYSNMSLSQIYGYLVSRVEFSRAEGEMEKGRAS